MVVLIPDSSRPSALELAFTRISRPYREGFVKNRYVGRTFIMPGHAMRKRACAEAEPDRQRIRGQTVLLVDDLSCAAPTSREIVQMAREAGAKKVFFASAAPPVIYPNVYGIDMPTPSEADRGGQDARAGGRSDWRRPRDLSKASTA